MHYELNENGYIDKLFFGCTSGECIEYTGTVPDGYTDLEDWAENSTVEAYKIIDGNLVYDSVKCAELEETYDKETAVNTHATVGYVDKSINNVLNAFGITESLPIKQVQGTAPLVLNASNAVLDKIDLYKVTRGIIDTFNIYIQGKNILTNTAVNKTVSGVEFSLNTDRSINIDGTASNDITYDIVGTSTSTDVLFILKKDITYYLNCGYLITLYSYDGTNRTQVYQGNSGVIELSEDAKITYVTLTIPNGSTLNNITIYPQIEKGANFTGYETCKETKIYPIDVSSNLLERIYLFPDETLLADLNVLPQDVAKDIISIDGTNATLYKNVNGYNVQDTRIYQFYLNDEIKTFDGSNTIYTDEDVYMEISYTANAYYDNVTYEDKLYLSNTFESKFAINKLEIDGFTTAASLLQIVSSKDGTTEDSIVEIDLYDTPDEIIKISYESGTLTVTEKVTFIDEHNVSSQEIIDATYDDIYFDTFDGETYLFIKSMDDLIYSCDYMMKSTFTNYFCTREEKDASIKVLEDSINLEVSQKVGFDEVVSSINLAIEDGQGLINFTGDSFKLSSTGESDLYVYTNEDVYLALTYIQGNCILPDALKSLYDVDNDGSVTVLDVVRMERIRDGIIQPVKTVNAVVSIDPKNSTDTIVASLNDELKTRIGIYQMYSYIMKTHDIYIGQYQENNNLYGTRINEKGITIFDEETVTGTKINSSSIDTGNVIGGYEFGGFSAKGYAMIGKDKDNHYSCKLIGSELHFYVDSTDFGRYNSAMGDWLYASVYGSDQRIKKDISSNIDENVLKAIEEIELKSFKFINDENEKICFGIIAQDLMSAFEKHGLDINEYRIIWKQMYLPNDDTLYCMVDYTEFLILKNKCLENKINNLEDRMTSIEKLLNEKGIK